MQAAQHTPGFRYQWLNQWPGEAVGKGAWLPEWDTAPDAAWDASLPVLGALDVSADRSCAGVAVAQLHDDGSTHVLTKVLRDVDECLEWLKPFDPVVVMAGVTVKELAIGPWITEAAGIKETRHSTPWFYDAVVKRGRIHHDHDPQTMDQFRAARIAVTEYGDVLSAKKSLGPIPAAKVATWAANGIAEDWFGIATAPQIW